MDSVFCQNTITQPWSRIIFWWKSSPPWAITITYTQYIFHKTQHISYKTQYIPYTNSVYLLHKLSISPTQTQYIPAYSRHSTSQYKTLSITLHTPSVNYQGQEPVSRLPQSQRALSPWHPHQQTAARGSCRWAVGWWNSWCCVWGSYPPSPSSSPEEE